jgi:predicted Zn-dependent protease
MAKTSYRKGRACYEQHTPPFSGVIETVGLEMAETSKRLEFLQKITSEGRGDSFAWYGLAMEFRSLERLDEALATFEKLRTVAADYVPMYLMCGQMLQSMGRANDARAWLTSGVQAAKTKGDAHALSELQAALDTL